MNKEQIWRQNKANDEPLKKALLQNVKRALETTYRLDNDLIAFRKADAFVPDDMHKFYIDENHFYHVSERGLVFKFGCYLQELNSKDPLLRNYTVDMEYNRHRHEVKKVEGWKNGCVPDLVIHKRQCDDYNLFVAEFKTWWNDNTVDDEKKIRALMDETSGYKYKYGATIVSAENLNECTVKLFSHKSDGEVDEGVKI